MCLPTAHLLAPPQTDSTPNPYWWYNGKMYLLAPSGNVMVSPGNSWNLTSRTTYNPGLTSGGAVDSAPDISSITGWVNAQRTRRPWVSGVISIGAPGSEVLYGFYHEEQGACPSTPATPVKCTSATAQAQCPGAGPFWQCYWDKYSSLPDPRPGGDGYCMTTTSGRAGVAMSTDHGNTWIDRGRIVSESLAAEYCAAATTGVGWSGGVEFPVPMLDPDGYVYVTISNLSGDPANPTALVNQGVLIARISIADLAQPDAQNRFNFWDNVTHSWTFSTQGTSASAVPPCPTCTWANYLTHVQPLANPHNTQSWSTPGPYPSPQGTYSLPQTAWNTNLGTYILQATNFIRINGGTQQPGLWYFAGASLASDPLNWQGFTTWRTPDGQIWQGSDWNNFTDIVYDFTPPGGPHLQSQCQYYLEMVGGAANAGCSAARGGGTDGLETDKCFADADWYTNNFGCPTPGTWTGVHESYMQIKFRAGADATCAGPNTPVAASPGRRWFP